MIRLADKKETRYFLNTVKKRAWRKRDPFKCMFELTYRCNFRCPHCYLTGTKKEKRELNTRQIFSVLRQLKEAGTYPIGFTGGEPLMREDIFEILEFANRCGFKTNILTNGSLIDEKAAAALKKVNVNFVAITLNSIRPEIFDRLSGVKGALGSVKRAIGILAKKDMQVGVSSLVTALNKDDIVEVSRYAGTLNIPHSIDSMIWPSHDGCSEWPDRYSLKDGELDHVRRQVYPEMFKGTRKVPKKNRLSKRKRIFECGAGVNSFAINPYGKLNFCLDIDYPYCDILKKGVRTCWKRVKEEVDRINSERDFACRSCGLSEYCGWCPAMSYMETGRFDSCSKFSKREALLRKDGAS
jgi:MoaA/NifB/PqqE/SkfB family radical SAM enzyme